MLLGPQYINQQYAIAYIYLWKLFQHLAPAMACTVDHMVLWLCLLIAYACSTLFHSVFDVHIHTDPVY